MSLKQGQIAFCAIIDDGAFDARYEQSFSGSSRRTPFSLTPVAPQILGDGLFRVYWKTSLPPEQHLESQAKGVDACAQGILYDNCFKGAFSW